MLHDVPTVHLGCFPTPLQELPRLARELGGPRLFVKRDDLSGLATGGNKARKLEYLMADALQQGARTVITTGAAQSNHARQTAAAAARLGLRAVLVLSGRAPQEANGNLLLDHLLGASVRWAGDRDPYEVMGEVAEEERAADRPPYVIPVGGSNAIGAAGYVQAMVELAAQLAAGPTRIDRIFLASGSGGTQAGLLVGAGHVGFAGRIHGVSVGPAAAHLCRTVAHIAGLTAALLRLPVTVLTADVDVDDTEAQVPYGHLGAPEREAIRLAARTEGLLLDPVYTGRAFAALLRRLRAGEFARTEALLFWHTGGTAALFPYARGLLQDASRGGQSARP